MQTASPEGIKQYFEFLDHDWNNACRLLTDLVSNPPRYELTEVLRIAYLMGVLGVYTFATKIEHDPDRKQVAQKYMEIMLDTISSMAKP